MKRPAVYDGSRPPAAGRPRRLSPSPLMLSTSGEALPRPLGLTRSSSSRSSSEPWRGPWSGFARLIQRHGASACGRHNVLEQAKLVLLEAVVLKVRSLCAVLSINLLIKPMMRWESRASPESPPCHPDLAALDGKTSAAACYLAVEPPVSSRAGDRGQASLSRPFQPHRRQSRLIAPGRRRAWRRQARMARSARLGYCRPARARREHDCGILRRDCARTYDCCAAQG